MATRTIRLSAGEWRFDDNVLLGPPGGFGEVFRGSGPQGDVAVKRLRLTAGAAAHRELKINARLSGRDLKHIVPVLDAGQDAETDHYFLVMPICEESLQDRLNREGPLPYPELREVMLHVIAGLREAADLVHRDLKPGNILKSGDVWKIADFGIAKFVEDSTSLHTLRESLTPSYAAPEQWRQESPSAATDVYALGCIVHALATGHPPFRGGMEDVRRGHLEEPPRQLANVPQRVAALVTAMLRKPPAGRPPISRCYSVFEATHTAPADSPALRALQTAGLEVASEQAQAEAAISAELARRRARAELATAAIEDVERICRRLIDHVLGETEVARVERGQLLFGQATWGLLTKPVAMPTPPERLPLCGWAVAAWGVVSLSQAGAGPLAYRIGATILYADRHDGEGYRWYELAFWSMGRMESEPYALQGHDERLDAALSRMIASDHIAYGPLAIDGEDEENFIERWTHVVAKASRGQLQRPAGMPLNPIAFFGS